MYLYSSLVRSMTSVDAPHMYQKHRKRCLYAMENADTCPDQIPTCTVEVSGGPWSVLAWLDDAIVHDVVDNSTVRVYRGQDDALGGSPGVVRILALALALGCRWRNHVDGVKNTSQPPQRPLLVEPGGQDPFTLGLCLDGEAAGCSSGAVGVLQQLHLLVWVDIEALGGEARDQRAGQGREGEGRVGVDAQLGPAVLVLEVVLDLAGERVQVLEMVGVAGALLGAAHKRLQRGGDGDSVGKACHGRLGAVGQWDGCSVGAAQGDDEMRRRRCFGLGRSEPIAQHTANGVRPPRSLQAHNTTTIYIHIYISLARYLRLHLRLFLRNPVPISLLSSLCPASIQFFANTSTLNNARRNFCPSPAAAR